MSWGEPVEMRDELLMPTRCSCPKTPWKRAYGNKEHAIHAAAKAEHKHKKPLRIYKCPHCSKFHLTTKNGDEKVLIKVHLKKE